ncbi:MAG: GatB/YqeY domain-containing protein [Gammaproteobacteria bacterium]|nr:GatB/YqeY domain-containing protein [Gammaproteobacteria bacterium]
MPGSELKQRIESDMKSAMRAKDKQRLGIIRMAMSEYKRIEIDERIELDDERVIRILDKMTKQRRESVTQYLKADRQDLVDQENYEISVLQEYLPEQLDEEAIDQLLEESIAETGASSMQQMGQLMAALRPKVQGRADMAAISKKVKARLSTG